MSKVELKKQVAIDRIAAHFLAEGLNKSGLRRLAEVAGTSDRMLIYYFGSKDGLLNTVFEATAGGVTAQLDALLGTHRRDSAELLAQLSSIVLSDGFTTSGQLWFELIGLAVRGEEPYRSNAQNLTDLWINWIAARLHESDNTDPKDLYAHLEGRLMVKLIQSDQ